MLLELEKEGVIVDIFGWEDLIKDTIVVSKRLFEEVLGLLLEISSSLLVVDKLILDLAQIMSESCAIEPALKVSYLYLGDSLLDQEKSAVVPFIFEDERECNIWIHDFVINFYDLFGVILHIRIVFIQVC